MYEAVTITCLFFLLLYVCGLGGELSFYCFMYETVTIHHMPLFFPPIIFVFGLGGEFCFMFMCLFGCKYNHDKLLLSLFLLLLGGECHYVVCVL